MEKRNKVIISFIFIILLVTGLYLFADWFSKTTGYAVGDDPDVDLAKCLAKEGVVFYGSVDCGKCREQNILFSNNAIREINYIDCSEDPGVCANLENIPAWVINGNIYYRIFSLNELRVLSGCGK